MSLGCASPLTGAVQCFGRAIRAAGQSGPELMPGPSGLGPAQIQSAYKLTGLNGSGRAVAIVDAYDDPNAASDLTKAPGVVAISNSYDCAEASSETSADSAFWRDAETTTGYTGPAPWWVGPGPLHSGGR